MHVSGLCEVCGEPASRMFTCRLCGKVTCKNCSQDDICRICLKKRVPGLTRH